MSRSRWAHTFVEASVPSFLSAFVSVSKLCNGSTRLKRREFIALLGGAATSWPFSAWAQQRVRRIGVLVGALAPDDPEWQARGNAFVQGLQERGWSDGRNVLYPAIH